MLLSANVKEILTEIGAYGYPRFIKLLEHNTSDDNLNKSIVFEEGDDPKFYFRTVLELYKKIPKVVSQYSEVLDASDGAFVCTTPAFGALVGWINNGKPTCNLLEMPVFSAAALREEQRKTETLMITITKLETELAGLREQMKIFLEGQMALGTPSSAPKLGLFK